MSGTLHIYKVGGHTYNTLQSITEWLLWLVLNPFYITTLPMARQSPVGHACLLRTYLPTCGYMHVTMCNAQIQCLPIMARMQEDASVGFFLCPHFLWENLFATSAAPNRSWPSDLTSCTMQPVVTMETKTLLCKKAIWPICQSMHMSGDKIAMLPLQIHIQACMLLYLQQVCMND